MSFYQKYRPKKICELDSVLVRESLEAILKSGKISHAYFFVGPRGSGKTSTARIMAQVVNCETNKERKDNLKEPCGVCPACISIANGSSVDVIEIDAASSGLVEDIRDLREKVRLAPVQLEKKVYIIDEVHMVSTAGFNALLKTLEEPPKHAIFILCTTEAQKVPETIVSRCTRISFPKANNKEVIASLMKALRGEQLDVDEDALMEIAEATYGSFREGHKLLEQVASYGKTIDSDLVLEVLGIVGHQSIKNLLEAAKKRESGKIVKIFADMEKAGIKAQVLAASLLTEVKNLMEEGLERGTDINDELKLIDELIEATDKIKVSPLPLLPLEIALLTLSIDGKGGGGVSPKVEMPAGQEKVRDGVKMKVDDIPLEDENDKSNIVVQNYDGPLVSLDRIKTEWMDFLNVMSSSYGSLAGMLRLVSPIDVKGKSVTLSVTSKFQQDMLERDVKKKLIEEQMSKVWGPITFRCVLGKNQEKLKHEESTGLESEPVENQTISEKGIADEAEKIFAG